MTTFKSVLVSTLFVFSLFAATATWASSLTESQENAVRSAKHYLSLEGFSRRGLIQQLSSSLGSGYSVADATVAVDSLHINWDKEAVRSAKHYLSLEGFSRRGLIQQLSLGSGYSVAEATVAVDSLHINWDKEAVRSAKQYLIIEGFSCRGLVQQLSSSVGAGTGYTVSQATYGAQKAGACQ